MKEEYAKQNWLSKLSHIIYNYRDFLFEITLPLTSIVVYALTLYGLVAFISVTLVILGGTFIIRLVNGIESLLGAKLISLTEISFSDYLIMQLNAGYQVPVNLVKKDDYCNLYCDDSNTEYVKFENTFIVLEWKRKCVRHNSAFSNNNNILKRMLNECKNNNNITNAILSNIAQHIKSHQFSDHETNIEIVSLFLPLFKNYPQNERMTLCYMLYDSFVEHYSVICYLFEETIYSTLNVYDRAELLALLLCNKLSFYSKNSKSKLTCFVNRIIGTSDSETLPQLELNIAHNSKILDNETTIATSLLMLNNLNQIDTHISKETLSEKESSLNSFIKLIQGVTK